MADVFISYSGKSTKTAEQIADALGRAGISYWFAKRHIKSGQSFPQEIQKAIKNCKIFLLILDKNSNESEHVLNEINLAFRRKNNHEAIDFLVFKTDDCKVSIDIDYFLSRFQHMDGNPLDTQRIQNLIAQIAELLGIEIQLSLKERDFSFIKKAKGVRTKYFKYKFIFIAGIMFSMIFSGGLIHGYQYSPVLSGILFCAFLFTGIFFSGYSLKICLIWASLHLMSGLYLWFLQWDEPWFIILHFITAILFILYGIMSKPMEQWYDEQLRDMGESVQSLDNTGQLKEAGRHGDAQGHEQ